MTVSEERSIRIAVTPGREPRGLGRDLYARPPPVKSSRTKPARKTQKIAEECSQNLTESTDEMLEDFRRMRVTEMGIRFPSEEFQKFYDCFSTKLNIDDLVNELFILITLSLMMKAILCMSVLFIYLAASTNAQLKLNEVTQQIATECAQNLTKPASEFLENFLAGNQIAFTVEIQREEYQEFYGCFLGRSNVTNADGSLNKANLGNALYSASGDSEASATASAAADALYDTLNANPLTGAIGASSLATSAAFKILGQELNTELSLLDIH
ncbi:Protein of unknown function [Gryllus bimaculatus]|nr:Protein of unknown function [Gryllus bimaculatus]